jgi:hypothetical protein
MSNASDSNKPQDRGAPAGSRSENSSLFSLDALKIKEVESAAQARSTKEDSGLIDLRALAAMERGADKSNSLGVALIAAPTDIFGATPGTPIMAPPPASAITSAPVGYGVPAKKSSTPIIIGGAVAAVVVAAAAFFLTRSSAPAVAAPTATVAASAAPTAAAPAEPATPDEPKVAAVVPGQRPQVAPSATPSAAPSAAPVAKVPGPMPKAKAAPTADTPPPPPPKPVETCDLGCQMKRAVDKKK